MITQPQVIKQQVQDYQTILVRLPNWVGDIVMATPSLRNLKEAYPDHQFIATGRPYSPDIVGANGIFDQFIPKPPKGSGPGAYIAYIKTLRTYENSAGILYTNSFSSALDLYLAGVRLRLGYQNEMRSFFLTHSIPLEEGLAMDEKYNNLTSTFGAFTDHKDLELGLDEKSLKIYQSILKKYSIQEEEILIGLNPGAGFGETKKWINDYFITLGKEMRRSFGPLRFLVFGGPGDEHRADQICEGLGKDALNLSKESLGLHNIKPFFSRMDLFITNDSGLRWYALAMKKPTIVLFGSTDPNLTRCFVDNTYPIQKKVYCSPCKYRVCPVGFECMRELTPEMVFDLVEKLRREKVWGKP